VPEGIRQLEEAWARAPDNAETAASLGLAWARVPSRPNLEKARAWLQRAAALAPTNARTSDQVGQVLQQLGRTAAAADAHLRALDLDPELTSAAASLARLAGPLDRPAHARLFGRIARALDDDHRDEERLYRRLWDITLAPTKNGSALADTHLDLARFLARRGELEKADRHLQQALEARPGWPPAASLRRTVAALLAWG
jgi:tetratricopeptide (TPR) repeat protein